MFLLRAQIKTVFIGSNHVCLKTYIEEKEIVNPKIEGRIVIDYQDTSTTSTTTSSTTTTTSSFAIKYSNSILTLLFSIQLSFYFSNM